MVWNFSDRRHCDVFNNICNSSVRLLYPVALSQELTFLLVFNQARFTSELVSGKLGSWPMATVYGV